MSFMKARRLFKPHCCWSSRSRWRLRFSSAPKRGIATSDEAGPCVSGGAVAICSALSRRRCQVPPSKTTAVPVLPKLTYKPRRSAPKTDPGGYSDYRVRRSLSGAVNLMTPKEHAGAMQTISMSA